MRARILGLFLTVLVAAESCSIKSDRSACPSLLFMSVSGGDDPGVSFRVGLDEQCRESVHISKVDGIAKAGFDLAKGKGYEVVSFNGVDQDWSGEIELGEQMPSLYAYACRVDCLSDVEEIDAALQKQFCRVFVDVIGLDCRVRIRSNVSGVVMGSLAPVPGQFYVIAQPLMYSDKSGARYMISIPRQLDSSLSLELLPPEGDDLTSLFTRNVGADLIESGVDWTSPSLDDVYINIAYVENAFSVSVQNWEKVEL